MERRRNKFLDTFLCLDLVLKDAECYVFEVAYAGNFLIKKYMLSNYLNQKVIVLKLLFLSFNEVTEVFLGRWFADLMVETLHHAIIVLDKYFVNLISFELL